MMNILKKILFIFIYVLLIWKVTAYNSNEIYNTTITWLINWTDIYIVPDWKDLIINKIQVNNVSYLWSMSIRDNGGNTLINTNNNIDTFINIKNKLEINQTTPSEIYNISGFLVSEDESVENYQQQNATGWTKNIFTKKDIDFIYFREFILFYFLSIIKFFSIIIGRKISIFN